MEKILEKNIVKGGGFLFNHPHFSEIFIPEEFNDEQKMIAKATQDFIDKEVFPFVERIDALEEGFMSSIMTKAGDLGLLGVCIPEQYGGLGMSFNTGMLIADIVASTGSFTTAFGAHTGIGTLPILYYGDDAQKEKYLPNLSSGKWKACYCLTEPDSGSDANAAKTKAVLSEDKQHYFISGQKMWISNAGFADLFIVFAKIEHDRNLTAFIVEKSFGGITMNDEERKMGIKGSSTRQVFFNETKVPVENMLSNRQNGFKIAVNILNIGRIKLGCGVINACKQIANQSTQYANDRKQFGVSISSFGAIKQKLSQMAVKTFGIESASYRAGQNIDDQVDVLIAQGHPEHEAKLQGVEQFAIEAAIIKVHGSDVLNEIADQGVQVYGGMGFSEEAPMARAYRDARIAKIYEGTNEINRMLLVGMIIKKIAKGEFNLKDELNFFNIGMIHKDTFDAAPLSKEYKAIKNLKKATLMIISKALETYGAKINEEQEVLINLSEMIIETYVAESTLLRTLKLIDQSVENSANLFINLTKLYLFDAVRKSKNAGYEALACMIDDEAHLDSLLKVMDRLTNYNHLNTSRLSRDITDEMILQNKFPYTLYS
ncbi:MAG: acyl-CoA dehydrogenase family protein [Cyclobacteriaceae bacterium]|nr:acyl-CoA dehydrogenase [Flammeovirgaceae bacterium]MDG1105416.1 acyl-CoA dehydrogenase family protein [Cyclobacteriaceae bacterium]